MDKEKDPVFKSDAGVFRAAAAPFGLSRPPGRLLQLMVTKESSK